MYLEGLGCRKDYVSALKWLKVASERNDLHAQEQLAKMYRLGLGIEENLKIAVYWYHRSSELGGVQSTFELATCYEHGLGVLQNSDESIRLYMLAAEQGHSIARYHVGVAYECGLGIEQDVQEAIDWYILAIQGNNEDAKNRFWALVDEGSFFPETYEEAKFAEKVGLDLNDPVCLFKESIRKMTGFDCPQDFTYFERVFKPYDTDKLEKDWRSVLWNRYVRAKDSMVTQNTFSAYYGECIFNGLVNENLKSLWLLTDFYKIQIEFVGHYYSQILSAALGSCGAQYNLGWDYHLGKNIERDIKKAIFWLKKSATKCKYGRDFGKLGFICDGVTSEKDRLDAAENYLRIGEELEKSNGMYDLSSCDKLGTIVEPNRERYIDYLTKSAKHGYASTMYHLANELALGISIEKSTRLEEYWLVKAANLEYPGALIGLAIQKERLLQTYSLEFVKFKNYRYELDEKFFMPIDESILIEIVRLYARAAEKDSDLAVYSLIMIDVSERIEKLTKTTKVILRRCLDRIFKEKKENLRILKEIQKMIISKLESLWSWVYGHEAGFPGHSYCSFCEEIIYNEIGRLEEWTSQIDGFIEQHQNCNSPNENLKQIRHDGESRRRRIEEKRSKEQEVSDMWYD